VREQKNKIQKNTVRAMNQNSNFEPNKVFDGTSNPIATHAHTLKKARDMCSVEKANNQNGYSSLRDLCMPSCC
jgi:hypothetical protein